MKALLRRVSTRTLKEFEFETFQEGPLEGSKNAWTCCAGETFRVRGKDYLTDKVKEPSAPNAFDLVEVEIFKSTTGKVENYAMCPESAIQRARKNGDKRFMLMVVFQTMTIHLVVTWAVEPRVMDEDPVMKDLWERYLNGSEQFRTERFKVIPRIADGGFFLRRLVGEKPGLLGKRLSFRYHQTESHLLVVCDTVTSSFASRITLACMDQASKLTIDLGFLIEATATKELPERLFGAFRMSKPDLDGAKPLTWTEDIPKNGTKTVKA
ncbi:hypothetical protein NDN08_006106 [Rhodosorus marinus]|uniref:Protein ENHANCED DISEASE RESISTANCE 2 C-terminal domain-containing protein n=1 Tax=Rhodosorus marinus TaxID=101924 RepID=A0AAV8UQC8_9RHOD|nr:hypothetical protein NDN08_006106 [Rhodosorus marinus]